MMNTQQYREHIECTFNAFCKIVLYYAVLVAYKELKRKQQFKVSLDYLRGMFSESAPPKNFEKHNIPTVFTVPGETVIVESKQLAAALLRLPKKRRKVLFLRYYLGYSDIEIGKMCV